MPKRTVKIAVLCLLLFSTNRLFAQEIAPQSLNKRSVNTPISAQWTPTETEAVGIAATGGKYSEATKSELYPTEFAAKVRAISHCDAPEVQELAQWARKTLIQLDAMVIYLDRNDPTNAWSYLEQLKQSTVELDTIRTNRTSNLSSNSVELSQGKSIPSDIAIKEILLGLERRGILWEAAIKADTKPSFPVSRHFGKGIVEIQRLQELTHNVECFFLNKNSGQVYDEKTGPLWCHYLDTQSFITELEACQRTLHQPNRRVSGNVSLIPISMLVAFCDRANVILSRLSDPELTENQRQYLNAPDIVAWKEELTGWSADTVAPITLIRGMERFEETGGMSDMENLFRLATRLSFSRTSTLRQLGRLANELYGGANIKLYISKVLINNLLPPPRPEVASFHDVIQQQSVYGRRRTDTAIEMSFIPARDRLLLSLDVAGTVKTTSRANAGITMLLTGGQAEYEAQKQIELTEDGFVLSPCHVQIRRNRLELLNFQTDFDRIPLLSSLVRNAVRNQYESHQPEARSETQQKISRQVRDRINRETENRFKEFNEKYRESIETLSNRFDLFLEKKDARTDGDWLLGSWAIRGQDSLCGNTPAPETLPGSFADLKVHESAINMFIGKLDFGGKAATVGEIRREIAEKFNRPQFAEPSDNDDVPITFAAYNPVTVRFVDGVAEISISIDSLKIQRQIYRNFKVLVRYRPIQNADGELVLKRDSVINLINAPRGQFPLRAAFAAIFPLDRPLSLNPPFLKTDPRFANLETGHCRIESGWFAIALIADENSTEKPQLGNSSSVNDIKRR